MSRGGFLRRGMRHGIGETRQRLRSFASLRMTTVCFVVLTSYGLQRSAGNGAYDKKRLGTGTNGLRKRSVGRFVRKILRTGEETQEWPALLRDMVADGAAKHGIRRLEGIQHGTDRDRPIHVEDDFVIDSSKSAKMRRKDDSDHWITCVYFSVWLGQRNTRRSLA
jgi:hypothetical protein